MRFSILLLSLLVVAATSCKKDDNDNGCLVTKQTDNNTGIITTVSYREGKPYRLEQSNGNAGQVTYNSDGLISLYELFNSSDTKVGYVEFEYTSSDKFLEKRTYVAGLLGGFTQRFRDVYEYTGDDVTKITNYDLEYSSTSINSYTTYAYNSADNVTTESKYGRDGSDNIILVSTITYEYDNNPSPAGDLAEFLNIFSENNVTVRNTTVYYPTASSTTDSIEYSYNEQGYPTLVTTFKDDGGVDSYSVEYNCD